MFGKFAPDLSTWDAAKLEEEAHFSTAAKEEVERIKAENSEFRQKPLPKTPTPPPPPSQSVKTPTAPTKTTRPLTLDSDSTIEARHVLAKENVGENRRPLGPATPAELHRQNVNEGIEDRIAAANAKAIKRKPVPNRDPKLGPQASYGVFVAPEELGLKAPELEPEPVAAGAERYIKTRADGKFDPSLILPGAPAAGAGAAPRGPATTFDAIPNLREAPPEEMPMPESNYDSPSERRPGLTRSTSTRSLTKSIKKVGSTVRRASAELAKGLAKAVKLAIAPSKSRDSFTRTKVERTATEHRKRSDEREQLCRSGELPRPNHEAELLRRHNFDAFEARRKEGKVRGDAVNPYSLELTQQMRDAHAAARRQERNATWRTAPAAARRSSAETFVSKKSLAPTERRVARVEAGVPEMPRPPPLDKWEKAGVKLGQMVDPIRGRQDSDASEWFGDEAPEDAMDVCGACGELPARTLRKGKCEECAVMGKGGKGKSEVR